MWLSPALRYSLFRSFIIPTEGAKTLVTLPTNCCSRRYIENDKRKEEEDKRCKDCKNKCEIEMKDRISKRVKLKIRRTKSSRSEGQAIIRREEIREAE